jgi:RNA polymerase sigma-70 factor (ECF subfamily)
MTDIPPAGVGSAEDELVVAARSDREAFGRLFDRFYPEVLRYALRRMLVRATAEDVASDVFLQVARHMRDFPGTTHEDFRRWLFRIATNAINARLRQSARRRELLEEAVRFGVVKAAGWTDSLANGDSASWSDVYVALGELPERDQAIVSLRYFGGLEPGQIAGTLKMTSGAVRTALGRALQKLRDRLLPQDTTHRRVPDDASSG